MTTEDDAPFDAPIEQPTAPKQRPQAAGADAAKAKALELARQKSEAPQGVDDEPDENAPEIVKFVQSDPGAVLVDEAKRGELVKYIEGEIANFVPDLSTGTGRKAVAAFAYKITRTKTALDNAGKALNAELRARIDQVDEKRREVRATFDDLMAKARKPLTDWEAAEEKRKTNREAFFNRLQELGSPLIGDTSTSIAERIEALDHLVPALDDFGDNHQAAIDMRTRALDDLRGHLARTVEAERVAAENERLRAEAAAREQELAKLRRQQQEREAEDARTARAREAGAAQAAAQKAEDEQRQAREAKAAELHQQQAENAREMATQLENVFLRVAELTDHKSDVPGLRSLLDGILDFGFSSEQYGDRAAELHASHARLVGAIRSKLMTFGLQAEADANQAVRRQRNTEARDSLVEVCALDKDKATEIVKAIIGDKIKYIHIGSTS